MKRLTHLYLACLLTAGWSLPLLAGEENTMPQSFFEKSIHGRAVQIDPGFAYYQDRSAESIASEVAMNGFECVHLILLDERKGVASQNWWKNKSVCPIITVAKTKS